MPNTTIFSSRIEFNKEYKKPCVGDFDHDGKHRFNCLYCLEIKNDNLTVVKIGITEVIRCRVDRIQSHLNKTNSKVGRILIVPNLHKKEELLIHDQLKNYRLAVKNQRKMLVHPFVIETFGELAASTEIFTCDFETVKKLVEKLGA
jgi:hypothetical protein